MKPWTGSALLAWIAFAGFLFAAWWPHFSQFALPLVGLQNLTNPIIGWPLAAITFALALLLSFPSFLTKERLLISAGFSFCLFVVTAFYASPVAAVVFLFVGANLVRETRSPKRTSQAEVVGK
jgi:hypothetical protein